MTKFYQLDKIIIRFPGHVPQCPKADVSAESVHWLTTYVSGKMGDAVILHVAKKPSAVHWKGRFNLTQ